MERNEQQLQPSPSQKAQQEQWLDVLERVCYKFYTGEAHEHGELLQWLVTLHVGDETARGCGKGEELAKTFLGVEFVSLVSRDTVFYNSCIARKNAARSNAHLTHAKDEEWAVLERIRRSQETFGLDEEIPNREIDTVKLLLGRLLDIFARDDGLNALLHSVYSFLIQQFENHQQCVIFEMSHQTLAQRSPELQKALCDFLSSIAVFRTAETMTSDSPLRWVMKPLVSNRTLSLLSRRVREAFVSKKMPLVSDGTNDCQPGNVLRTNVDGVNDIDSTISQSCRNFVCGLFY